MTGDIDVLFLRDHIEVPSQRSACLSKKAPNVLSICLLIFIFEPSLQGGSERSAVSLVSMSRTYPGNNLLAVGAYTYLRSSGRSTPFTPFVADSEIFFTVTVLKCTLLGHGRTG